MKKAWIGALTLALVLSAATVSSFAAGHGYGQRFAGYTGNKVCDYTGANCHYVDADGDGYCGLTPGQTAAMWTPDGDGYCDYAGTNCRYVDADGDGICDYYGTGWGAGNGAGMGVNYTDENGDGVCDNLGTGLRPMDGTGYGHGCHGGRNG